MGTKDQGEQGSRRGDEEGVSSLSRVDEKASAAGDGLFSLKHCFFFKKKTHFTTVDTTANDAHVSHITSHHRHRLHCDDQCRWPIEGAVEILERGKDN